MLFEFGRKERKFQVAMQQWTAWLTERSQLEQALPAMDAPASGLPVLEDAPGSYMLQR